MTTEAVALLTSARAPRPGDSLLLSNVHVLDIQSGQWRRNHSILMEGDRISSVSAINPEATRVIDGGGRWVIPGLIDCHVHVTAATADLRALTQWPASYVAHRAAQTMAAMLRRGFTTVRDINGADHGLARAEREGLIAGPRMFFGGKGLSPTGGHSDVRGPQEYLVDSGADRPGLGRVADGVDGVRLAARDELRKGADHIKIMASGGIVSPTDRLDSLQYSAAEIEAVVGEARNAKRYVAAHAYTAEAIGRALDLGVRSIEHGNFVDEECARKLVDNDAFLVPTSVVYWHLVEEGRELGLTDSQLAKARKVLDAALEGIEIATAAGASIAYGTDLLGVMHQHQSQEFEIRARVQAPIDVLRSATTVGARLVGAEDLLGRIEPGYLADLVVVDRDPLEDITALSQGAPWLVVHDGVPVGAGRGT